MLRGKAQINNKSKNSLLTANDFMTRAGRDSIHRRQVALKAIDHTALWTEDAC